MNRFVCGDLVTLSASGRKGTQNHSVYGLIGIVWEMKQKSEYPIQVKWIGATVGGTPMGADMLPMKEHEIKFAKHGVVVKH